MDRPPNWPCLCFPYSHYWSPQISFESTINQVDGMNKPIPPPLPFGPMDGVGKDGNQPHQDYDDPYHPQGNPYDFQQQQHRHLPPHMQPSGFMEPIEMMHSDQFRFGFRDHPNHPRIPPPGSYPSDPRDSPYHNMPNAGPAPPQPPSQPYKILCITNINNKVSDGPVKETLINDFNRFGDISVSICHDSGERLAYIYFRSYEEAREARHTKTRTLLFDKPIEIEPIYDPRASSPVEPNFNIPQQYALRTRRSITPPDYYDVSLLPPHARRGHPLQPPAPPQPYHHLRDIPSPGFHPNRSPIHPGAPGPSFDRHFPKPLPHMEPPYEQYDPYPPDPELYPYPRGNSYRHPYGPPQPPLPQPPPQQPSPYPHALQRDREHSMNELPRNLRHEQYHRLDQRVRDYPPTPAVQMPPQPLAKEHRRYPPDLSPGYPTSRRSPYSDHSSPRFMSRDYRREKYGADGYNNNNLDNDEGKPSRILFVTNIDQSKSEEEIRHIFSPFGTIEDMEVRKILSSDISSCLIKFSSMDCAYRAKMAIKGKYLAGSKKLCRVAYGKINTSRRLWIGGLGHSTTVSSLQDEFNKFGKIINLDYISGRPYAYVEYDTANQAQFATHHLKGTIFADAERKIRIEYVDSVVDRVNDSRSNKNDLNTTHQQHDPNTRSQSTNDSWNSGPGSNESSTNQISQHNSNVLKRSLSPNNETSILKLMRMQERNTSNDYVPSAKSPESIHNRSNAHDNNEEMNNNLESSDTNVNLADRNGRVSSDVSTLINPRPEAILTIPNQSVLNKCSKISKIVASCPISWFSQLVLRNFSFPCKMSMCSGQKSIIEKYIIKLNSQNSTNPGDPFPILKITQRWRLNPQPKLEEVKRKMQTANLGILIITHATYNQSSPASSASPQSTCVKTLTPTQTATKQNGDDKEIELDKSTNSNNTDSPTTSQSRPLKNLISYLEQKDAAGVISLSSLDRSDAPDGSKLLYTFPPGEFAMNLLRLKAKNLSPEATKEEFLLGVIV